MIFFADQWFCYKHTVEHHTKIQYRKKCVVRPTCDIEFSMVHVAEIYWVYINNPIDFKKIFSIIMPTNFVESVSDMLWLPTLIFGKIRFFRWENKINLLLLWLSLISSLINRLLTISSSKFKVFEIRSGSVLLNLQERVLSSAKSVNLKKNWILRRH